MGPNQDDRTGNSRPWAVSVPSGFVTRGQSLVGMADMVAATRGSLSWALGVQTPSSK